MRFPALIQALRGLLVLPVAPSDAERPSPHAVGASPRRGSLLSRRLLFPFALLLSAVIGSWFPQFSAPLRAVFAPKEQRSSEAAAPKAVEGLVRLSAEQIAAAKIATAEAQAGALTRTMTTPALVMADPDRVGRVAAKVAGTVAELRKKLGDAVAKGEVIAVIDSREVADAKSEYLAAQVNYDLQNTLFQREKGLFDKKITAEQLFLKAQTAHAEARLRLDLARQKLASLDLSDAEIAALPHQPVRDLRRKDIHAPVAGKVIERRVSVGQPVGGEGQDKELYVLADLSTVWADLSVPIARLHDIHEKQSVSLAHGDETAKGKIVFISPMINHETHSGRVIASFDNHDFRLRPGTAMTAHIMIGEKKALLEVPKAAVQMINGEPVVFVRAPDGFVKRKVETGQSDDDSIEIVSGLKPGEIVAASNTFVLKAEVGKTELDSLD